MGLRIYHEPDEVETRKPAVKNDPTASARSAIRRQRTVRYSPSTRLPSIPTISSTTYRPYHTSGRTRTSDRQSLLEEIRRRESALDSFSRNTAASNTTELGASHRGYSFVHSVELAPDRTSRRNRRGNGRRPVQNSFGSEPSGNRIMLARDTTVPEAPEMQFPSGMTLISGEPSLESGNLYPSRGIHWPTPPYTSGDSSESSPMRRPTPPLGTASLTPRFAPAHRFTREVEGESIVAGQSLATRQESLAILAERIPSPEEAVNEEDRAFLSIFASHLETMRRRSPETLTTHYLATEAAYLRNIEERLNLISMSSMAEARSTLVEDLPPLRRMAPSYDNEARRWAVPRRYRESQDPRAADDSLDGLGDRQRSFSPDDEDWETMLTTITPDERVPSAQSSFTTATASATSQSSNSMASSSFGTVVTVPSNPADIDTCPAENSDSSEERAINTSEEDLFIGEAQDRHRRARSRPHGYQPSLADLFQHPTWRAQQARLDEFSQGVARHREELDGHLQRLEGDLQRLNRHIVEDRSFDRQRPEERL